MSSKITRLRNLGFFFWGHIKNKIWDVPRPQQPITIWQLSSPTVRKCRNMPAVLIQTLLMIWSTDADNDKMLLNIYFPMNSVIIDKLALNLVDIYLDKMLVILCKSLLCFAKIWQIDYSKITKIWFLKFCKFKSKIKYISLSFQPISTILISKSELKYVLSNIKEILRIKRKAFFLLLI